jgi:hypothetical protein
VYPAVKASALPTANLDFELMVANKGFMSEQEKDNQVAVSSLFTAAMIGGISAGGILGAKAVVKPSSTRVPFVFSIFISCRANLKHGSFTFMGRMDYYGIANERIINSLKESIKKNDVFEKVKIDRIYKDDLIFVLTF